MSKDLLSATQRIVEETGKKISSGVSKALALPLFDALLSAGYKVQLVPTIATDEGNWECGYGKEYPFEIRQKNFLSQFCVQDQSKSDGYSVKKSKERSDKASVVFIETLKHDGLWHSGEGLCSAHQQ